MASAGRVASVYVYKSPFQGVPQKANVKIVQEVLPPLKDGEYLAEAKYLRVNPDHRIFACAQKEGATVAGTQIAKITESKNKKFEVGQYLVGNFGWRTHTVTSDSTASILPEAADVPHTLFLGSLGVPGIAAYFGLLEVCKLQEGNVVVISSAAGAVGSHAGQIAKLKGCKVIGIVGSDQKGNWVVNDLGFDHYINYKTQNIAQKLAEVAPDGVDCYFDNVGGEISSAVIYSMKTFGRICICGATALYINKDKASEVQTPIKIKHAKMEGILVERWADRFAEATQSNLQWIRDNKLRYKETTTEGFEHALEALQKSLNGDSIGNAIVKI